MHIHLGTWSRDELDRILLDASLIQDPGLCIEYIAQQFLDLPYKESSLIGDDHTEEVLVIDFSGVDCFTFIDYIEAMRMSESFEAFPEHLTRIRYRSGQISFKKRNHFFTDWSVYNADFIEDATESVGKEQVGRIRKMLNDKEDGTCWIPGIPVAERTIFYIPGRAIDHSVINRLKTGDYVGMYSELPGLDVSHVGIIVRHDDRVFLRHASSDKDNMRVIDQDFMQYIKGKPGLIVLRPIKVIID
ncbi:MAG: DUF1460 domain-containing protein [Nitrospiraceae bacterium]|jgi:hypothetical protein|nr:MAG: DUF1460 domain-containing protein [Nitrospiraceae bacterium]